MNIETFDVPNYDMPMRGLHAKGGGGGGSSETTTKVRIPKTFKPLAGSMDKMGDKAADIAMRGIADISRGDTDFATDLTQEQLDAMELAKGTMGIQNEIAAGGMGAFGGMLDMGRNPLQSEITQEAIRQSDLGINRQLAEMMPGMRSQAAAAGQAGSSRAGIAEGVATRGALEAGAANRSAILNQAMDRGLRANQSAMGSMGALRGAHLGAANTLGAVGDALYGQQVREDTANLRARQAQLGLLGQGINSAGSAISPFLGTSTTSSMGGGGGGGNFFQGALGGAMSGASMGPWGMVGGGILGGLGSMG